MKHLILFLLFVFNINIADCQNIQNPKNKYEIIKRPQTAIVNPNLKLKKHSRKQIDDIKFTKELASTLSEDLYSKTDKIIITEQIATLNRKDTLNYVVYDFVLKKEVSTDEAVKTLNFGIKPINSYEMPIICISFLNEDKITFISKGLYKSDFIKDEEFITTIKANTEARLNAAIKNQPRR
ncbi:hypothetical protein [Flavobacterium sp. H122]|uniref:hypothetical protein n=1 Tax=Flavobacterium sp. H122 TaxID=2529860 RepID=UPI0010AA3B37|nr:hypothetical protein [Flavobacterium sp. H122]